MAGRHGALTAKGRVRSRALRRMAALNGALRLLARGANLVVHPTPQSLVRYRAGELPPDRQSEIQEHFLFCPHCAELLLDLGRFAAAGQGPVAPPDRALTEAWRALCARLAALVRSPRER